MFDFRYVSDYVAYPDLQKESTADDLTEDMIKAERARRSAHIQKFTEYPEGKFKGKGIVMVAGGVRYLTCAYVNISMLRRTGCNLPIEMWYLGRREVDARAMKLFSHLNVTFRDVEDCITDFPIRKIGGWEMNVYAIINSHFEEVFFLDADNTALIDLRETFEWPQYLETGAVFWPDYGRLGRNRAIWKLMDLEYENEEEFESGQILMNKKKCWKELMLTNYLNQYSDVYYRCVWGDKETYHMAWKALGTKYHMIPRGIHRLHGCMSQHDFHDNIILQHRNMDKWKLEKGKNRQINGFLEEEACFEYLSELRERWDGTIDPPMPQTAKEWEVYEELRGTKLVYEFPDREGDGREIELKDDFYTEGAGHIEKMWYPRELDGEVYLMFANNNTSIICKKKGKTWQGMWVSHELFRVLLYPVDTPSDDPGRLIGFEKRMYDNDYSTEIIDFSEVAMSLSESIYNFHGGSIKRVGEIGVRSVSDSVALYFSIKGASVVVAEPYAETFSDLEMELVNRPAELHPVLVSSRRGYADMVLADPADIVGPQAYPNLSNSRHVYSAEVKPDGKATTKVITRTMSDIDPGDLDAVHIAMDGAELSVLSTMTSRPLILSLELFGPAEYTNKEIIGVEKWLIDNHYYVVGRSGSCLILRHMPDDGVDSLRNKALTLNTEKGSYKIRLTASGGITGDKTYSHWEVVTSYSKMQVVLYTADFDKQVLIQTSDGNWISTTGDTLR